MGIEISKGIRVANQLTLDKDIILIYPGGL
jgi:hypothetical protein